MTAAIPATDPWPVRHHVPRRLRAVEVLVSDEDRFKWQRLAATIRRDIAAGRPALGELLPPIRKLVEIHGQSDNTVTRALAALADEGLVRGEQSIGYRVISAEPKVPPTTEERLEELERKVAEQEERLSRLEQPEAD
jgi:GntR family phosphonate transport system transcriptional regulator